MHGFYTIARICVGLVLVSSLCAKIFALHPDWVFFLGGGLKIIYEFCGSGKKEGKCDSRLTLFNLAWQ